MQHTADREIALRCAWYLIAKFGTVRDIQKKTGIGRQTFYAWKNGDSVPSAYWLQYLVQIGADGNYLLTGKRG